MKYPRIKEGIYILKTDEIYAHTQNVSIKQDGMSVEISFINSLIEKNVSIKGIWIFNQKYNKYILNLVNDYNNKKMFFCVDKCYNEYFTLIGGYDLDSQLFQIEKQI